MTDDQDHSRRATNTATRVFSGHTGRHERTSSARRPPVPPHPSRRSSSVAGWTRQGRRGRRRDLTTVPFPPFTRGGAAGSRSSTRRWPGCRACPRLVDWRRRSAADTRRAFADWDYWARPVPGFGPTDARMLLVGLAPAAHGGNRTGRMFTGDRAGDVLVEALHARGARRPAHRHPPGRRAGAARRALHGARALRPARQQAHPRRTGHLPPLAGPRAGAAAAQRAQRRGTGGLRLAGVASGAARGGLGGSAPPPAPSATACGERSRRDAAGAPAGLLPPQSAQHLHRQADLRHARRAAGTRRRTRGAVAVQETDAPGGHPG